MPSSIDELVSWGNANGLRNPSTGSWQCAPFTASGSYIRSDTGEVLSWPDIDNRLETASYPGPDDHSGAEIAAFQNACGCSLASTSATPTSDLSGVFVGNDGRIINGWADMDRQLHGANYPGPYDHGSQEIGAYQRACLCTLTPVAGPPPPVCSSGLYMTINGSKSVDQMRSELHVAGYPNWQWASAAELVSVYGRTSGRPINGCAGDQSPPTTVIPVPTPAPPGRHPSGIYVGPSNASTGTFAQIAPLACWPLSFLTPERLSSGSFAVTFGGSVTCDTPLASIQLNVNLWQIFPDSTSPAKFLAPGVAAESDPCFGCSTHRVNTTSFQPLPAGSVARLTFQATMQLPPGYSWISWDPNYWQCTLPNTQIMSCLVVRDVPLE